MDGHDYNYIEKRWSELYRKIDEEFKYCIKPVTECLLELKERIEKIEKFEKHIIETLGDHKLALDKLESYMEMEDRVPRKAKPHICPVCEGHGCDVAGYKLADHDKCDGCCKPCTGTGVLWG